MEFSIAESASGDAGTMDTSARLPRVTLVVPCYNEVACLVETATRLIEVLGELRDARMIHQDSRLCMVDDGSTDETWGIIQSMSQSMSMCCGIRLTRNFGHQNALLAGLMSAPGDVLVTLDADLQDDPEVLGDMIGAYRDGSDIVYAVREDRSTDSWWKRAPAQAYYKLMRVLGVNVIYNHADYRLMSRRAIESLREYREVNLFLRGLVTSLGYAHATVKYSRKTRAAGETKYPLSKMLALAFNGVTSFSAAPLRFIAIVGLIVFLGSLLVSGWALWTRLFTDNAVPGWASSVIPIYFLGGIQLLSIAVVGEYVAKIYLETKARPRFLVQEISGMQDTAGSVAEQATIQR